MTVNPWNVHTQPPNEKWVEVQDGENVIEAMAFFGRDEYRPHWQLRDNSTCEARRFVTWREIVQPEEKRMKVRIEAVISTAGNNEQYVGHHLGLATIGRPFRRMVVTFEDDLTEEELTRLRESFNCREDLVRSFMFGENAIQIHSFRVAFLYACSGGFWIDDKD